MIRPSERKDASRLAEILIFGKRVAYRSIFKNDIVSFNEMQVLDLALSFRDQEHELDNIYVYDDGIVKGMIKWEKEKKYGLDCIRIHELYIDTFFQRQCIGSFLISDCIHKAKEQKVTTILLWVLEENIAGRSFYEKQGFRYSGINTFEEETTVRLLEYALKL